MATALRSHFGGYVNPSPPTVARPAEDRRLDREERKRSRERARAEYQRLRAEAKWRAEVLADVGKDEPTAWPASRKPRRGDDFDARVARRMIRRWYGRDGLETVPALMADVRYWQALSCGWQLLEGRTEGGAPKEPVNAFTWSWWADRLCASQRRMFVREARAAGFGCYRVTYDRRAA